MMLRELVEYAETHGLVAEPGFAPKRARWAVCFSEDGRFLRVIEIGDVEANGNRGRKFACAPQLIHSELVSGPQEEKRCHFLIESADVVALYCREEPDERVLKKHEYFIRLLRGAGEVMPELAQAADALEDEATLARIRDQLAEQRARPTDGVTILWGERFPVEDDRWHAWWREFRAELSPPDGKRVQLFRDFITGTLVAPAATHPPVKGLQDVDGRSDCSLIAFDKAAFTSYGLEQSANCAMSEESAAAYCAALNHLLAHSSHTLAGMKVVHWFQQAVPPEDDPIDFLNDPPEVEELNAQERARKLLEAIHTGERPDLGRNYFYAISMSGAGGRVMVRDWMEGQFETLAGSISRWFEDLEIVATDGAERAPLPRMETVLTCMLKPKTQQQRYEDWVRPLSSVRSHVWRAAIVGQQFPPAVLAHLLPPLSRSISSGEIDALVRGRSSGNYPKAGHVLHARMGLIRAYHVRNCRLRGEIAMSEATTPGLNPEHPSPAYHCGRLMAILAGLQRAALGDVGAGVVQRYYAAASSTPSLVLGRLTRLSMFHLSKLASSGVKQTGGKKDTPQKPPSQEDEERSGQGGGGLARWYEDRIGEVYTRLGDAIPKTLTPEEQSLFALGYYQQLVDLRTRKADSAQPEGENTDE